MNTIKLNINISWSNETWVKIVNHRRTSSFVDAESDFTSMTNANCQLVSKLNLSSVCSICDHKYFGRVDMEKHMFMHTGERPYTCTLCNKRFIHWNSIWCHVRQKHVNVNEHGRQKKVFKITEQAFACELCDKRFRYFRKLYSVKYPVFFCWIFRQPCRLCMTCLRCCAQYLI